MWGQREIRLRPRPRGFHLITDEVVESLPELGEIGVGLAHLFLRHTSASLTVNENASPDVRRDFATWFDRAVPDGASYFEHTLEGPDDMPAHIKSSLTGDEIDYICDYARRHDRFPHETTGDRFFSEQQVVDLTVISGIYVTVAMVLAVSEAVPPGNELPFKPGEP